MSGGLCPDATARSRKTRILKHVRFCAGGRAEEIRTYLKANGYILRSGLDVFLGSAQRPSYQSARRFRL
jgi:hypothetical protein